MNILGELRAKEAIEQLVEHLNDIEGPIGLSEHWYPAQHALHKIGPAAVPAVGRALSNPDPETRKYAAQTLGLIGGKAAREELQRALPGEKNELVRGTIRQDLGTRLR